MDEQILIEAVLHAQGRCCWEEYWANFGNMAVPLHDHRTPYHTFAHPPSIFLALFSILPTSSAGGRRKWSINPSFRHLEGLQAAGTGCVVITRNNERQGRLSRTISHGSALCTCLPILPFYPANEVAGRIFTPNRQPPTALPRSKQAGSGMALICAAAG